MLRSNKLVGCRWIYTIKHKSDGTLNRYKARLMEIGYTQIYDINYVDTFTPVAKMDIIWVILSIVAYYICELRKLDAKNVFFHGNLKEEVNMEIPSRFSTMSGANEVCRLRKILYGLKQFLRTWFKICTEEKLSLVYKKS